MSAFTDALQGAGAIGSGFAQLIGGRQQKKIAKMQIDAAKEENRLAREFNYKLFQEQNAYNTEMWQKTNEWNSASAVKQRLMQAGLNPDLMYTQGVAGAGTASSAMSSANAAAATPADTSGYGNMPNMGDISLKALQAAQMVANINLTKSQARKTDEETKGQEITNSTLFDMYSSQIELNKTDIKQKFVEMGVSEKKAENLAAQTLQINQNTKNLVAEFDQIVAQTENISFEQKMRRLEYELNNKRTLAQIAEIGSKISLNYQQSISIAKQLPYILQEYSSKVRNIDANTELTQQQRSESKSREFLNIVSKDEVLAKTLKTNQEYLKLKSEYERDVPKNMLEGMKYNGSAGGLYIMTEYIGDLLGNILPFKGLISIGGK